MHLGHKNILHHQPQRQDFMGLNNEEDIKNHDEYIIKTWLSQTKRGDHIYVCGDFIMNKDYNEAHRILHRLKSNGCIIHFIVGNHDKQTLKFPEMFMSIDQIKNVTFKKSVFPFLDDDLNIIMSHYPFLTWEGKCRGSIMMHGHTHDNSPWENEGCDLRINVGLDTQMANGRLISLEEINEWYKKKLNGLTPSQYIDKCTEMNSTFIR